MVDPRKIRLRAGTRVAQRRLTWKNVRNCQLRPNREKKENMTWSLLKQCCPAKINWGFPGDIFRSNITNFLTLLLQFAGHFVSNSHSTIQWWYSRYECIWYLCLMHATIFQDSRAYHLLHDHHDLNSKQLRAWFCLEPLYVSMHISRPGFKHSARAAAPPARWAQ